MLKLTCVMCPSKQEGISTGPCKRENLDIAFNKGLIVDYFSGTLRLRRTVSALNCGDATMRKFSVKKDILLHSLLGLHN